MPRRKKPATSARRRPKVETEISFIEPPAPDEVEIPEQKKHYQLPTRFGAALTCVSARWILKVSDAKGLSYS